MKKTLMVALLTLASIFVMAAPSGYYQARHGGVQISGSTFYVCRSNGEVLVKWEIVKEENGVLTLRSSLGATATASWWNDNGATYLNFNGQTYTKK